MKQNSAFSYQEITIQIVFNIYFYFLYEEEVYILYYINKLINLVEELKKYAKYEGYTEKDS